MAREGAVPVNSTRFLGRPADPKTRECDWCLRPARTAHEIYKTKTGEKKGIGTAQYLYACPKHEALAEEASRVG